MRVRPTPGVSVTVDADGRLDLLDRTDTGSRRFSCGPVGTAMWIALRQHDGDADAAAGTLAAMWGTTPVNTRADLDIWVEEMRDAGLVRKEF
ncbi:MULTISPECIES: PqqD family protein [Streptomyces]|uniref:PqqD family protein n=1 Tax=Streptomyces lienomycini TaxID=284035 RepID=A0ABV9X4I8_9ACTN|nr:PqqD family protein [Streptomyces sp. NBC_00334]